jgi:hypothetical protein
MDVAPLMMAREASTTWTPAVILAFASRFEEWSLVHRGEGNRGVGAQLAALA